MSLNGQLPQVATPQAAVTHRSILLTVGTDHHPFDRVVRWFDSWLAGVEQRDDVEIDAFVQRATAAAGRAESVEYLSFDDLVAAIKGADIVITHGGPGSIVECRGLLL